MGSSVSFSYWTAEEEEQNKKAMQVQESSKENVLEFMYYGIPVRCGKASHDPRSVLWIEIDPQVLEKAHLGKGDIMMATIETVPSAVAVNHKGEIKVIFTSSSIEYKLHLSDFLDANKYDDPDAPASAPVFVPAPKPPILLEAQQTKLKLKMLLPQPPGIAQHLELQYATITPQIYKESKQYLSKLRQLLDDGVDVRSLLVEKEKNRDVYRAVDPIYDLGKCPFQWNSLSTRMYYKPNFLNFTLDKLLPGDCYCFRLRYMNHRAWSDYSYSSRLLETLPAPPSVPDAPIVGFTSSTSIQLFWIPPNRDNGSPIKEYCIQGKSAGGEYVELFRGQNTSFLVTDLHPEFIYSFEVAAINSAGISKWSNATSVTTPKLADKPRPRDPDSFEWLMALQFRDAWRELWDPQTERVFYFNTITGTRQLETPEALDTDIALHEFEENDGNMSMKASTKGNNRRIETAAESDRRIEIEFRKKRYRLMKTVHTLKSKNDKSEVKNVEIRRQNLLLDGFRKFSTSTNVDYAKRFKFTFAGEPGIDSGGVGKEVFLLLSRQAALYAGDNYRGWMFTPDEKNGALFFSDETHVKNTMKSLANDDKNGIEGNSSLESIPGKLTEDTIQDMSKTSSEKFCKFLGRFLGKAIYDRQLVDIPLSPLLLKHMLGLNINALVLNAKNAAASANTEDQKVSIGKDEEVSVQTLLDEIKDLDSEMYSSLKWMSSNDITDIIFEKFAVGIIERKVNADSGIGSTSVREIALCADGENRNVTEENKEEYIKLLIEWKTNYAVIRVLEPFLQGFHELIPLNILQDCAILTDELNLLLNGKPVVDVDELRAYCIYQGSKDSPWGEEHETIVWLWQTLRDLPQNDVRIILSFFTGSARVPLDGYDPPLNITHGTDMDPNSLPRSHTCFNQLVLPQFDSYHVLKEKLLFAAKETEGFTLS